MKRLGNNFDEWDREADRLKGMGLLEAVQKYKPKTKKDYDGLFNRFNGHIDNQHKKRNWTGLSVGILILGCVLSVFLFSLIAFG